MVNFYAIKNSVQSTLINKSKQFNLINFYITNNYKAFYCLKD